MSEENPPIKESPEKREIPTLPDGGTKYRFPYVPNPPIPEKNEK